MIGWPSSLKRPKARFESLSTGCGAASAIFSARRWPKPSPTLRRSTGRSGIWFKPSGASRENTRGSARRALPGFLLSRREVCPTCGAVLVPGDSPSPICVRCALDLALGSSSDDRPTELAAETGGEAPLSQQRIGPYLLRRILGEGGMGIVWEADQEEPIRRRVALKCMRVGMNSAQFLARFESERQALALMSHPSIARAFDAGCTSDGHPYFAMELIDGPWITRYCDAHQLNIRHRLELFMEVCRGIQHAHQRGVIHRDIKPSNVLVQVDEGHPVPKIIDFGVAKAMGAHLT